MTSESLVHFPVDREGIDFPGFGFPDLDGLAGCGEMDIGDFVFEQRSDSDAVLDAEGKEAQNTGPGGTGLFTGCLQAGEWTERGVRNRASGD